MRKVKKFKHVDWGFEIWKDEDDKLHVEIPEDPFCLRPHEYELNLVDPNNGIYELIFWDYDREITWKLREI